MVLIGNRLRRRRRPRPSRRCRSKGSSTHVICIIHQHTQSDAPGLGVLRKVAPGGRNRHIDEKHTTPGDAVFDRAKCVSPWHQMSTTGLRQNREIRTCCFAYDTLVHWYTDRLRRGSCVGLISKKTPTVHKHGPRTMNAAASVSSLTALTTGHCITGLPSSPSSFFLLISHPTTIHPARRPIRPQHPSATHNIPLLWSQDAGVDDLKVRALTRQLSWAQRPSLASSDDLHSH